MAEIVKEEHKHTESCSCGHDHSEHEHRHTENCSCGHDHDHDQDATCICGHNHKLEAEGGVGHDRAMGRLSFAVLGGLLTVNSFLLGWLLPNQGFASYMSALLGAFILALPIIMTAIKDLINGKVYMNELVALAILAALASGDFQTAGIIAFFLLLTIIIETRTASGAQRSIEDLIKLTPNTARRLDGETNAEVEVQAAELKVGDRIRVRPGENFPVDARVLTGESTVNQASITGESLPVEKSVGDDVFAGTQNLTGLVDLEVTKVGEDTTLGKVKDMILQAEQSRTPVVRIIDRYAGYYTPTVLMLALITWYFSNGDMNRVITLMVISCPCAVVLATPTAVVAAVAAAARLGIFIKNVSHLELAGKITSFVFDKTGTLTDGLLSVVKLNPFGDVSPAELLKIAATAEQYSNHPVAVALQKLADEASLELDSATDFQEVPGKGVTAKINGSVCMRSVAVIALELLILTGLGCVFGGILTLPTAIFVAISYLLFGSFAIYMSNLDYVSGAADHLGQSIARLLLWIVIPIQGFEISALVANGEIVELTYFWLLFKSYFLFRALPLFLLGMILYRRRELGLVIRK